MSELIEGTSIARPVFRAERNTTHRLTDKQAIAFAQLFERHEHAGRGENYVAGYRDPLCAVIGCAPRKEIES